MIRFRPFIQELVVFFHFSSLRSNLHIPQCVCVCVCARNHIKSLLRVALIMSLLTHSHSKKNTKKIFWLVSSPSLLVQSYCQPPFFNHLSIFTSYKLQGIFQHVFDDTSWVSWTQWTPQLFGSYYLHLFTIHTVYVAGGLRHQAHLPWCSSSLPKWRRDATRGRASELRFFGAAELRHLERPWGNHSEVKTLLVRLVYTWWLIPLSKWVITPVISGLTLLIPFITGVITHLLSGMSHQVVNQQVIIYWL